MQSAYMYLLLAVLLSKYLCAFIYLLLQAVVNFFILYNFDSKDVRS